MQSKSFSKPYFHLPHSSSRRTTRTRRRGVALVEGAVCFPIIVLVVFGMLQLCHLAYLRQKLTSATYIGMQQLAQSSATDANVVSTVKAILASRSIIEAQVTVSPTGVLGTATIPTTYTLRVEAPIYSNLPNPKLIPISGTIVIEQVLYK